jgi:sugar transferase (PEP-CTERM/EpsH1 system associated)
LASSNPTPDRLRILAVAARPFYPADSGGRIRSSQIFERLARMHHVTMLCFTTPEDRPEQVERMRACCSTLETIAWHETPKRSPRFYAELAACLLSPLPYTVWKYRSDAMQRRIHTRLTSSGYDLLLCDFLQPSVNCIDETFTPKILFQHNVEAVIRQRQVRHVSNPVTRAYVQLEARKLRRFEQRAAEVFDRCIMVSDDDCQTMEAQYGVTSTTAVPTGVDIDYFTPGQEGAAPEIVFVGSMDWLANQDAVAYFLAEILPRIRRQVPATFSIVGRNPPEAMRRQAARVPDVHVTGTVEDVRPYVARAQLYVVPLRIGGGTRIKIFEAMAMKKAILSTSIGAEGLPVTHGEDLLIADQPEVFAEQAIRLLREPALRQRLGDAARTLVASRFTWDAAAARFADVCSDVVRQRNRRDRLEGQ